MFNLRERWRSYKTLPSVERALLLRALFWLPVTGMALKVLGVKRTLTFAPPRGFEPIDPAKQLASARRIAHLVDVAARLGLYRASCLPRSIVLQRLLAQEGLDATLRIGVRKDGAALEAHAWIECMGEPLIDGPEVRSQYSVFDASLSPERWI